MVKMSDECEREAGGRLGVPGVGHGVVAGMEFAVEFIGG
jgi:hypothetical protein